MAGLIPQNSMASAAGEWGDMREQASASAHADFQRRALRQEYNEERVTNRQDAALRRRQLSEQLAPLLQPPDTSGYAPNAPQQSGPLNIRPPEQVGLTTEQQQGNEQFARAMTTRQPAASDAFPNTQAALNAPDEGPMPLPPTATANQRNVHGVYQRGLQNYLAGRTSESALRTYISNMERTGLISREQAQQLTARHVASYNHRFGVPQPPNEPGTGTRALRDVPLDASGKGRTPAAPASPSGTPAASPTGASLQGRATEVADFLRQNGIQVNSTVRQHNAGREHPVGNAIDIDATSQADVDRAVQLISQRYGVQARGIFLQGGTRNANGTVNTGDHGHISLGGEGGAPATPGANQQQAGLQTEEDEPVNQVGDISRPTGGGNRELAVLRTSATMALERAQLLAGRGNMSGSDQAMALALQYHAGAISLERQTQVRQIDMGNLDAGAALIADLNDYEPGTVQFAPSEGDPNLYNLQVRGADGQWQTTNSNPLSIDDWAGQLHRTVNAELAAAQDEAANARLELLLDRQTRLDVANIEASTRIFAEMSQDRRARLTAETQRAIADQRAQVVEIGDDGTQVAVYWGVNATTGERELQTEIIGMREEESPSTDGNGETEIRPYRETLGGRATGTVGVQAQ
jgi:hypothetical protein